MKLLDALNNTRQQVYNLGPAYSNSRRKRKLPLYLIKRQATESKEEVQMNSTLS